MRFVETARAEHDRALKRFIVFDRKCNEMGRNGALK